MNRIEVEGMHRLHGEAEIQGSKNAVLPILAACVLNEGETILYGCPKIKDVFSMLEMLEYAGAAWKWEKDALILNTASMNSVPLIEKAGCMRSSIMLLGSFLARFGKAVLGYPGGCCIGKRPIDLHEQALSALGAVFTEYDSCIEACCDRLEGCDVYLPYSSVGATENLVLAAAGASGMTRIYGAAREPEITELCRFLTAMGIRIYGTGTDRLFVMGGRCERHVEYRICSDRIVAGTYMMAVAAAGGDVLLRNVPMEQMKCTIQTIGHLGAMVHRVENDLRIQMKTLPKPVNYLYTAPYPGFPTDLQSPLLASLCRAQGRSCIEERVFENRFLIVEELKKMGAQIQKEDRRVYISPVEKLFGTSVRIKDLRGGAALVIAALEAEGKTLLEPAEPVFRGYEDIVKDLYQMGASIRRIT